MSSGSAIRPIALIQTAIPFALCYRFYRDHQPSSSLSLCEREGVRVSSNTKRLHAPLLPILVALALLLAIALPWYLYLLAKVPGAWDAWLGEATMRDEIATERRAPWYHYLQFIPMMAPWTVWIVVGLIALFVDNPYRHNRRIRLALVLVVVPIFIMSFFWVKRNRYLLPMLAPASILAAWGLMVHLPGWLRSKPTNRVLVSVN